MQNERRKKNRQAHRVVTNVPGSDCTKRVRAREKRKMETEHEAQATTQTPNNSDRNDLEIIEEVSADNESTAITKEYQPLPQSVTPCIISQ